MKADEVRAARERSRQIELPLGDCPKIILCQSCFGLGCAECGNSGVTQDGG